MKIGIVGAGIGGLTLAALLHKQNHEVRIYEKKPSIQEICAGIGIGDNVLTKLGDHDLAKGIKNEGQLLKSMCIHDEEGQTLSQVAFPETATNLTLLRQSLVDTIATYVDQQHIYFNYEVTGVHASNNRVTLDFSTNESEHFDLVVAADGIHSTIRQSVAPDTKVRYQGYTCFRGVVEDMNTCDHIAEEYWGKKGRFGIVPLLNGKAYWFATINAKEKDPNYLHFNKPYLQAYFNHFPEKVRMILDKQPETEILHHDIYDLKPLKSFVFDQRIVLLGDAAHATTPNMGQGASQAMEDAIVLNNVLLKYPLIEALKRYDRLRVKHTTKVIHKSRKIGKMAQKDGKLSRVFRNKLLQFTPNRLLIKQMAFLNKAKSE
ncbi:FAD-dependent monooxygenase [Staphylococcus hyicus]|uniref:FAD-dependent monooxygenase n=1 Tax=Staphylococcus hyicus TaxID=1284 RepID=UPI000D1F61DB|nr:FAD-dependent monooxygenase [Staphylococcus hyicus]PTJ72720.1 hypothetical protein BUZ58_03025 [Staphylococcus hyicus]